MKFDYKKSFIKPDHGFESGILYQTKIPVVLVGPKGELRFEALVDTGSDQTILPSPDVEDITGITIQKDITSEVKGRLEGHTEKLFWGKDCALLLAQDNEVYRFSSSVWFSDDGNSPAILGHSGFLEFFTATFDGENHALTLEPAKNFPGKIVNLWTQNRS